MEQNINTRQMRGTMQQEVRAAVEAMRRGGVIIYPTETVWGIGCDATNAVAVARIFELKRRQDAKAMITLVSDLGMLERYVSNIPDVAYELIEASIRPLTVVYDHPVGIAPALLAPDGSAGVRITGSPFARALCRALGRPVVSSSANLSGGPTPRSFSDIPRELTDGADYVVDFERDRVSDCPPSSVIKLSDGGIIRILRP